MTRSRTVYISLGIVMLLAGCKIVDAIIDTAGPLPRLPNWGYLTAEMNGVEWSTTYKNAYQVTHGSTTYADNPKGVFYALTSILYSPEGCERQQLLFQNNPKTQEIKGSFQLTLANARIPRSSNALPDTLRFRNGRFHTKIIRYRARGE